ncbi:hypothetical protein L2E82_10475 [Cichorium intybus]|uniref:Uncharacterized protein n=1 Tax=Cichorium intybus TaxID=13427 RepID=A0ACB9GAG6_CICIN|nr:hypothetical protein L2E82_10475 [Cichorium intybus]
MKISWFSCFSHTHAEKGFCILCVQKESSHNGNLLKTLKMKPLSRSHHPFPPSSVAGTPPPAANNSPPHHLSEPSSPPPSLFRYLLMLLLEKEEAGGTPFFPSEPDLQFLA